MRERVREAQSITVITVLQIHILERRRTGLVNWKTRILERWTTLAQK